MREARLKIDKSQLRLMKETKIHYSTLSRIERGWQNPTQIQRKKLSRALKVSEEWVFPDEQ
jgi:transcriptional regulator with XRE-family HTH domain